LGQPGPAAFSAVRGTGPIEEDSAAAQISNEADRGDFKNPTVYRMFREK
jgi:hypothetical protein